MVRGEGKDVLPVLVTLTHTLLLLYDYPQLCTELSRSAAESSFHSLTPHCYLNVPVSLLPINLSSSSTHDQKS